jgi:hypothetical protein
MLNGQFVKIERALEKVYRDFDDVYKVNFAEAVEWIGEAISEIGAYDVLTDKVTDGNKEFNNPAPVEIKNYRAKLPCDLYHLVEIRYTDNYNETNGEFTGSCPMVNATNNMYKSVENRLYKGGKSLGYNVDNGYVYTEDIEDGHLIIAYKSFVLDERGFPMIPDDDRYIRAITAYIEERIALRLWMSDIISEKKYAHYEREWLFYVNSAYTKAKLLSYDKAEAFRNSFLRLINETNHDNTSYRYLGTEEKYKIH